MRLSEAQKRKFLQIFHDNDKQTCINDFHDLTGYSIEAITAYYDVISESPELQKIRKRIKRSEAQCEYLDKEIIKLRKAGFTGKEVIKIINDKFKNHQFDGRRFTPVNRDFVFNSFRRIKSKVEA